MFTGVLIIANYAVILFENLGISGYLPLLLLALWTTASFPGNCFTALFVDKIGRRTLMLVGACGILVSLVCECALQAVFAGGNNKAGQKAAIFFIYFFILFWSSCFDATQYLYLSVRHRVCMLRSKLLLTSHRRSSQRKLEARGPLWACSIRCVSRVARVVAEQADLS